FVPFISGGSKMHYGKFITYNILGGLLWTGLFTIIGFFFGNIPFVKDHFSMIVIAIILVSVVPIAIVAIKKKISQSEENTSELQSRFDLVCRLLPEKKNKNNI